MPDLVYDFADMSHDDQNRAVVGALRLAHAGSENPEVLLLMTRHLLEKAPPSPGDDYSSVHLFVDAIRELGLEVGAPSGRQLHRA